MELVSSRCYCAHRQPGRQGAFTVHQIRGYGRAYSLAFRIQHVEDHDLVFDEIVVEPHFFPFLSGQYQIRKNIFAGSARGKR